MSNLKEQEYIESFFIDNVLNILESQKLQNISVFKGNSESTHQKVIICTSTSNTQMNGVVKKVNGEGGDEKNNNGAVQKSDGDKVTPEKKVLISAVGKGKGDDKNGKEETVPPTEEPTTSKTIGTHPFS